LVPHPVLLLLLHQKAVQPQLLHLLLGQRFVYQSSSIAFYLFKKPRLTPNTSREMRLWKMRQQNIGRIWNNKNAI